MADEVFESLVAQGVDPAEARAASDKAVVEREANRPKPPDLKEVYAASKPKAPNPGPEPGDRPPGFNQAVYDDLVKRGYNEAFCLEYACRGWTEEHARDVAEHQKFIEGI
jgi:hypothetical protein